MRKNIIGNERRLPWPPFHVVYMLRIYLARGGDVDFMLASDKLEMPKRRQFDG